MDFNEQGITVETANKWIRQLQQIFVWPI